MWTRETIKRLEKELDIPVNIDTLFFYDREGIVPVKREQHGELSFRNYTEKDITKLGKALMLSYLGTDTNTIHEILNNDNRQLAQIVVEKIGKIHSILKENL